MQCQPRSRSGLLENSAQICQELLRPSPNRCLVQSDETKGVATDVNCNSASLRAPNPNLQLQVSKHLHKRDTNDKALIATDPWNGTTALLRKEYIERRNFHIASNYVLTQICKESCTFEFAH